LKIRSFLGIPLTGCDDMDVKTLRLRQELPLKDKIKLSLEKITTWYEYWEGKVYVAFSGGKDSTVLLDLVRSKYPDVPAVFVDTGLEYPEIKEFVKSVDNVSWIKPKIPFHKVIGKYGYPVISKTVSMAISRYNNTTSQKQREYRLNGGMKGENAGVIPHKYRYLLNAPFKISEKCCDVMKKAPSHAYNCKSGRMAFTGEMAKDSNNRREQYLKYGCNAISKTHPKSTPLGFWTESDIWEYIHSKDIPYSRIYDIGYDRTGCMFCMFGVHLEKEPNRFQRMAITHPKHYRFCMEKLELREVLGYMNIPYKPFNQTKIEGF